MKHDKISQRQWLAISFMNALTAGIRILPEGPAHIAGAAGWLAPFAAAGPLFLYTWLMSAFFNKRREGEGLVQLFQRCLGEIGGKILAFLFGIWILFYIGFSVRASAERLLSTIYQNGSVLFFGGLTMAAAALVASGRVRTLVRTAEAFFPVISVIILFVLLFASFGIKTENLLPVSYLDTGNVALAALPILDAISLYVYGGFILQHVEIQEKQRPYRWAAWVLLLNFLILFVTIGFMSADLIEHIRNPFFVMIRNVRFFGVIEHVEGTIIVLWVALDFLLLAGLLTVQSEIMRSVTNVKERRHFVWPAAVVAMVIGMLIAPSQFAFARFSDFIVPLIHSAIVFVLLPIVFLVGKLRKQL